MVASRFSGLLAKSEGHFQRRRRPCRHSDERAAKRFRGVPIYSRRDLAVFGVDNSEINRLRGMEIFCWT